MERVDGIIPRRDLPDGVDLDEATPRAVQRRLDVLIDLHAVDVSAMPALSAR